MRMKHISSLTFSNRLTVRSPSLSPFCKFEYVCVGHAPASAMFATNARYKRESYRGSEFAARILADNGLPVVMKV